ncbi:MAG: phosphonate C-P lyase system protein PhnG [Cyanobacteria bacterium P01_E01_bin.34]
MKRHLVRIDMGINTPDQSERQLWMATLAKSKLADLEDHLAELVVPDYTVLRSPEIGLVMVRGRAGGTGQPFNLGEMTVTRCVVQMSGPEGEISGFGYVAGRSHRHAELAAVGDALMQHPSWREQVRDKTIAPLQVIAAQQRTEQQEQTASTRVNFFTMPRGER